MLFQVPVDIFGDGLGAMDLADMGTGTLVVNDRKDEKSQDPEDRSGQDDEFFPGAWRVHEFAGKVRHAFESLKG